MSRTDNIVEPPRPHAPALATASADRGAIAGLLAIFHALLLRGLGGFIADDEPFAAADYIVILPSVAEDTAAIDQAIEAMRRGEATGLLFFAMPPPRGVRCGAWPDYETVVRRYLQAKGISAAAITFVPGSSRNSWDAARALGNWCGSRKPARLEILCEQFRGRYERHIFAAAFPGEMAGQLHFVTAAGHIDASRWWCDREGIQVVFQNYARLAFVALNGEAKSGGEEWTFDQYEQSLPPAPLVR